MRVARLRWAFLAVACVAYAACSEDATPARSVADASPPDASTTGDAAPSDSSPAPDVQPIDSGFVDPWNPPLEGIVAGVTTYEGWETPRLLPAPVNVDGGWTDSVMVTSDARHLFFAYTTFDFDSLFSKGAFVVSGARRPGMNVDGFRIFRADLHPSGFLVFPHTFPDDDPNVLESSASVNVTQTVMVLTRWVQQDGGLAADLYFSTFVDGAWSKPAPLAINSPCTDDNGFIVGTLGSEMTLYFESNRVDETGTTCGTKKHLFTTTFADGAFSPVQRVSGINGAGANDEDQQPFVSPDGNTAIWTALRESPPFYGVRIADRSGSTFVNDRPLLAADGVSPPRAGKLVLIGEANVAELPQGWVMYMMCGIAGSDSDAGPADIRVRVCFSRRPR